MVEDKNRDCEGQSKPESASKGGKHAYDENRDTARERASPADKSHEDSSRGNRNREPFRDERNRASETGRKSR